MRVMTVRWRMRLCRVHNLAVCLVVLLAGALIGSGCAARSVNDVMADPGRYRNRDVNVAGEVTESVGVLGKGFFKLQDESGSLWVYTSRGLPRKGARVESKGTIRDLASIDSVPDSVRQAVGSGLLLVESDRKAQ
jgi:hypothetical protein